MSKDFVVVDCETTGLNSNTDRIIQLSALRYSRDKNKPIDQFNEIILPSGEWEMGEIASSIHGITEEMVRNSGKSLTDVVKDFQRVIKDADIVGYNSNSFDIEFIYNEFLRLGIELDMDRMFYDAFLIEKTIHSNKLEAVFKRRLGRSMEECGLTAHDSLSDVKATAAVFLDQIKEIGWDEVDAMECNRLYSPEGSIEVNEGVVRFKVGKYKNQSVVDIYNKDKGYLRWWSNNVATPYSRAVVRDHIIKKTGGN